MEDGTAVLVERHGLPLEGIRAELVNGCFYVRPVGLGEGSEPNPPPAVVMKLIARIHPELRRRTRTAARAFEEKWWRDEVDRWFERDRAEVVAANLTFQRIDLSGLEDEDLVGHVTELLDHFGTQAELNLANHGGDMIPTGDFLAHCEGWGIGYSEAASLLGGSSPATTDTVDVLVPVARGLAETDAHPASVEEVTELGPEVEEAVETWFEYHGWRLVTSDDVDGRTLAELPALQLTALLAATDATAGDQDPPDASSLRVRVPQAERGLFDELLAEARYGMRQRDDVVGIRWNWSAGRLRRALLEVGRRLVQRGRLKTSERVVELDAAEVGIC